MMMRYIVRDVLRRVISLETVLENIYLMGDDTCRYLRGRIRWNRHTLLIRTTTDRKVQDFKQKAESPQHSSSLTPLRIPLPPLPTFILLHPRSHQSQHPILDVHQVWNPWTVRGG